MVKTLLPGQNNGFSARLEVKKNPIHARGEVNEQRPAMLLPKVPMLPDENSLY